MNAKFLWFNLNTLFGSRRSKAKNASSGENNSESTAAGTFYIIDVTAIPH